jgi:hypothetical protein
MVKLIRQVRRTLRGIAVAFLEYQPSCGDNNDRW